MLSDVLFILTVFTVSTVGSFIQVPNDVVIPSKSSTVAPFFCQHSAADDIIWLVNEMSLTQYHPPGIVVCTNTLPDTEILSKLKIEVRPEYNGTTIVCVAALSSSVERTTPAYLIVQDDAMPLPRGFMELPQSQVVTLGKRGNFSCQHCAADNINWRLNGATLRANTIPEGIMITYNLPQNLICGAVHTLIIDDRLSPMHNESMIQCEADINGAPNERSEQASFLVQGKLDPVTNLSRTFTSNQESVVYIWQPPFSLNVTSIDPDIAYCVVIDEITCLINEGDNVVHNCSITQPYYELPKNLDTDKIYTIEVSPRPNVESDNNIRLDATNSTIHKDAFISFNNSAFHIDIRADTDSEVQVHVQLNVQGLNSSTVRPNSLTMRLTSAYNMINSSIMCPMTLRYTDIETAEYVLNCSNLLNLQQLYLTTMVQIPIYDCATNNISILSTHLIQNISVTTAVQSGVIMVSGDLMNVTLNITPIGFLAIAYSNSDQQLHYGIATPAYKELHSEVALSRSRSPGYEYRVSVYSIKPDGLPYNRSVVAPQSPEDAEIPNQLLMESDVNNATPSFSASYERECINCTFTDDSASSCVVIVSNKSNINDLYGLLNIEIFDLPRDGQSAYKCISKSTSDYDVVVFAFDKNLRMINGPAVTVAVHVSGSENGPKILKKSYVNVVVATVFILVWGILIIILLGCKYFVPKWRSMNQIKPDREASLELINEMNPDQDIAAEGKDLVYIPHDQFNELESDVDIKKNKSILHV